MEIDLSEEQDKPFELDNEFVIRLPPSHAEKVRAAIRTEVKHWKNRLQIEIDPSMRRGSVIFDDCKLRGKLYDLPTTIESYKTLDRKVFYKVADICHIMVCKGDDNESASDEESVNKVDRDGREKKYLFPHGITLPLKNVRRRRFRKTTRNKYNEAPSVEKEVKILLKTDAEAISSRFELVSAEDDKLKADDEGEFETTNEISNGKRTELGEYDIFGEVSSSSEDSDVEHQDTEKIDVVGDECVEETPLESKEETDSDMEMQVEQASEKERLLSQQESKAAELNLGHILEGQSAIEDDKAHLELKVLELEHEILNIQAQRRVQEENLLHIENFALKQRLQANLDSLKMEEQHKQNEYNRIMYFLQHS